MIGWPKTRDICKRCNNWPVEVNSQSKDYCDRCHDIYVTYEEPMTPDALYNAGYEDGKAAKAMNASWMTDPNYTMGYNDGKGDRTIERPVEELYTDFNDAPEGFEYTGEKRVAEPYEFYLSKGGSATFLERPRKNKQTRHILRCSECNNTDSQECWHHYEVKGRR